MFPSNHKYTFLFDIIKVYLLEEIIAMVFASLVYCQSILQQSMFPLSALLQVQSFF